MARRSSPQHPGRRVLEQRLGLASGLLLGVFVAGVVAAVVIRRRRHRRQVSV